MKSVICSRASGDSLVLSGGVIALSKKLDEPLLHICHGQTYDMLYLLYMDTDVRPIRIEDAWYMPEVHNVLSGEGNLDDFIVSGHHVNTAYPLDPKKSWMEWLYEPLGVPLSESWDSCTIEKARKKVEQVKWPQDVAFLHDDMMRGLEISVFPNGIKFRRVHYNPKITILSYCDAIENAPEIHVIDSAFFHLVERLKPKGKLFLHRYAKRYLPGWDDGPMRMEWEIVDDKRLAKRSRIMDVLGALG